MIEFFDRYTATGTPDPDPNTMCLGPCEGMGFFPVNGERDFNDGRDGEFNTLWKIACAIECGGGECKESLNYHFVTCPDCNGTRLRLDILDSDDQIE